MTNSPSPKSEKKASSKMTPKKLITYAVVIAAVLAVAIFVDYDMRNPPTKDETDALNMTIQKVLPIMDEISPTDGFGLDVGELVTLEGKNFYPVLVTWVEVNENEEATGNERVVGTVYIRTKDSKPFLLDETTGGLVPYTGQAMPEAVG